MTGAYFLGNQQIEIRQALKAASKELEGPIYRIARKTVEILKLY